MTIQVSLVSNCDDAVVLWKIPASIPDCWGFAIEKEMKDEKKGVVRTTLDNRMGFERDKPRIGEHRPSTQWPFQRFWWADFTANVGQTVRYRVIPMAHTGGKLQALMSDASDWTDWATLSGGTQDGMSSFFNRGMLISQFMSRYLEDLRVKQGLTTTREALTAFKDSLKNHEEPIRIFLSGELRLALLDLLQTASRKKQHVYAALYELDDDELVSALCALGARAHVVLANGSIQAKKGEGAANARRRDQNKEARARLEKAKVDLHGRFISPGALGHNKFLVIADSKNKPMAVWTGSTNWTGTGLCTQTNNGFLVKDGEAAAQYRDQWIRLRDAKNEFPASLVDANNLPAEFSVGKSKGRIWFSRTTKQVDLAAINDVLNNAKEGVLFLMFQPGNQGPLGTIRTLQNGRKRLYIKGVVSTLPKNDESQVTVKAVNSSKSVSSTLDVVQPQGAHPFANWAATVKRNEFLTKQGGVIGFAIIHSKLIVVDPFTNPVVITGSHNFSANASKKNDENFVIIEGNKELAMHYASHILSVYHHYRWQAYVNNRQAKGSSPTGYLQEIDAWQAPQLKGDGAREMDFWVR
ncbi:phospholipase D-like domain-containing protein [Pinirhizobacter soli]|uniref:phospholipase D-like domain-containing protein n=1 Tax=Pinirhizobacter soli TaxID=2786953 RepID=UPI002029B933|nr:phospholipase D-like domain-containing protein [Pinirhizobacter soli]